VKCIIRRLGVETTGLSLLTCTVAMIGGMAVFGIMPTAHRATAAENAASLESPQTATKDKVLPVVKLQVVPFNLRDVRLLNGPFKHAMELDRKYLLSLDPGRLLLVFRLNAGIPSDAKPYGGWMAPNARSRGEFVGHYLSACARMYANTGDATLKNNAACVVTGLAECQRKFGNGYLHTHADTFSGRGEAPVPFWYQMHKVLAGLLDMHEYCGNEQALEVASKLGDWAAGAAAKFSDAQIQSMLNLEHGGINEAFASLYARTGDERYLKLSRRFNHMAVIGPAMKQMDMLDGLHANTQIPKFIGAAREYDLTGDDSFRAASIFFWETVVRERSYVIGGHSNGEVFSPKATLSQAIGPNMCETCNTYNMLKLTRHLFCWKPKAEYADYCERAVFNHILGSQNPETGMMGYYMPMNNAPKLFGGPTDTFWCCYGTGIENHTRYGDSIYFHNADKCLYVNLFLTSELQWQELGLTLRQETRFPESDTSRLTFACRKPVQMTVKLRQPYWAASGIEIAVNGKKEEVANRPSSYVSLMRQWQTGDTIEVRMPMSIHTEGFRDNPRRLAILYGPLALSMPCEPRTPSPVIVADIDRIPAAVRPTGRPLCFEGSPTVFRRIASGQNDPVTLIPFHRQYKQPYVTYWDIVDESQWKTECKRYEAEANRHKALAARTIDRVLITNEQSEKTHRIQGENSQTCPDNENRMWRHAIYGGWFSYKMNSSQIHPLGLFCTYWGTDIPGAREFDILVDGVTIATERLKCDRPNEFVDRFYPIPENLAVGKGHLTIRFQAHPGKTAGGVFDCRLLKGK
jgi:uncharacterized protein